MKKGRHSNLFCKAVHEGRYTIEEPKAIKQQDIIDKSNNISFAECATNYIDIYRSGWKNKKYVKQLQSILSYYALFIIGKLLVLNIDTKLVSEELELIWHNKTETQTVLATVRGYR